MNFVIYLSMSKTHRVRTVTVFCQLYSEGHALRKECVWITARLSTVKLKGTALSLKSQLIFRL